MSALVARRETAWIEVGSIEAIPRLGARVVQTSSGDIAVFRTAADTVFAIDDRCPHRGGPLSCGIIHGERVTCPLHAWQVELTSGAAVAPDTGAVRRYDTRVVDGVIYLRLGQEPR